MKPFILLIVVFGIATGFFKISSGSWHFVFGGNLAMFFMLCLTGIAHFKFTEGMTLMIPGIIPFKRELVYFTGIAEIVLGLGLLIPQFRYAAGIALVLLFLIMLPANISAAINHINYEKAGYDGHGPSYLWFRIPLQLFFIAWVLYFSVQNDL